MSDEEKPTQVWEISPKSIFFILGILGGLWLIVILRDVLVSLFIAVIVTTALAPAVYWLRTRARLPFGVTLLIVYLGVIAVFVGLGFIIIPPLISQVGNFITVLPRFATTAFENLGIVQGAQAEQFQTEIVSFISGRIGDVAQGAYNVTLTIFSAFISLVSILVFSFYLLIEKERVEEFLVNNMPFVKAKRRKQLLEIITHIELKLGAWARGQIALCVIIGVITYFGLWALNVPFRLPLAVIAGLLEIVPVIGPIISAIPALIVVLAYNPVQALLIAGLYTLIQQLENHLIVPQVMKRAVGFSPLVSILAIMIGSSLMGIAGALLAIPFVATLFVILEYYTKK